MITLYDEYAALDIKIKALTAQKDQMKDLIIEDMVKKGEKPVDVGVGKFVLAKVKTWTYTDKVTELEEAYKARKAKEESTGDATYVEKPSLRFTSVKL